MVLEILNARAHTVSSEKVTGREAVFSSIQVTQNVVFLALIKPFVLLSRLGFALV